MPLPDHFRVTYSGVLGSQAAPIEQWSLSFNLDASGGVGDVFTTATRTALTQSWANGIQNVMPNDVWLTRSRIAAVVGGRVVKDSAGAYQQLDNNDAFQGAGGPARSLPASACLVASLMTARAGSTGRGRVFLPFPGFEVSSSDKLLGQAQAILVADAVKATVNGLNAVPGTGRVSVVSSRGYASPVTSIRVGRRPDVLRSRSKGQLERYEAMTGTLA
jgi:hypothetical protein